MFDYLGSSPPPQIWEDNAWQNAAVSAAQPGQVAPQAGQPQGFGSKISNFLSSPQGAMALAAFGSAISPEGTLGAKLGPVAFHMAQGQAAKQYMDSQKAEQVSTADKLLHKDHPFSGSTVEKTMPDGTKVVTTKSAPQSELAKAEVLRAQAAGGQSYVAAPGTDVPIGTAQGSVAPDGLRPTNPKTASWTGVYAPPGQPGESNPVVGAPAVRTNVQVPAPAQAPPKTQPPISQSLGPVEQRSPFGTSPSPQASGVGLFPEQIIAAGREAREAAASPYSIAHTQKVSEHLGSQMLSEAQARQLAAPHKVSLDFLGLPGAVVDLTGHQIADLTVAMQHLEIQKAKAAQEKDPSIQAIRMLQLQEAQRKIQAQTLIAAAGNDPEKLKALPFWVQHMLGVSVGKDEGIDKEGSKLREIEEKVMAESFGVMTPVAEEKIKARIRLQFPGQGEEMIKRWQASKNPESQSNISGAIGSSPGPGAGPRTLVPGKTTKDGRPVYLGIDGQYYDSPY